MIDLHIHTNVSDGTYGPAVVAGLAKEAGLEAVGITDHDSVDGIETFLRECRVLGIEGISGIEVSVVSGTQTLHLLGYFVNPESEDLLALLRKVKSERVRRSELVVERLNEQGLELDIDDVRRIAGDSSYGRPHIAIAMKRMGYVSSVDQAFSRYLRKGGKAYVNRYKPDLEETISLIGKAGGVSVLAHPISLGLIRDDLYTMLRGFRDLGLQGVEAYHPTQYRDFQVSLAAMAEKLSLVITGGSDFHGEVKPEWKIGVGHGNMRIPYNLVEKLKQRLLEIH